MLGPRVRCYFALVLSIVVASACGDYTQPTSPPPAARKLVSPTSANFSRYILISGVWTLVEDDSGEGQTVQADSGGYIVGGTPLALPGPEALPSAPVFPSAPALPTTPALPSAPVFPSWTVLPDSTGP